MCEQEPATAAWGLPVCQSCAEGLDATQRMLEEEEANDPHLAELGRRVEESAARFFAAGPTLAEVVAQAIWCEVCKTDNCGVVAHWPLLNQVAHIQHGIREPFSSAAYEPQDFAAADAVLAALRAHLVEHPSLEELGMEQVGWIGGVSLSSLHSDELHEWCLKQGHDHSRCEPVYALVGPDRHAAEPAAPAAPLDTPQGDLDELTWRAAHPEDIGW